MREVGKAMDRLTFPLSIAAGMEARGLKPGHPKMVVSKTSAAIHSQTVAKLRARFEEWKLSPCSRV